MDDISRADILRRQIQRPAGTFSQCFWQIGHAHDTVSGGRELLRATRLRLKAAQESWIDRTRAWKPEHALLVHLSNPRCTAVVTNLPFMAEATTDGAEAVALLYDVPFERAVRMVAESRAQDRLLI